MTDVVQLHTVARVSVASWGGMTGYCDPVAFSGALTRAHAREAGSQRRTSGVRGAISLKSSDQTGTKRGPAVVMKSGERMGYERGTIFARLCGARLSNAGGKTWGIWRVIFELTGLDRFLVAQMRFSSYAAYAAKTREANVGQKCSTFSKFVGKLVGCAIHG